MLFLLSGFPPTYLCSEAPFLFLSRVLSSIFPEGLGGLLVAKDGQAGQVAVADLGEDRPPPLLPPGGLGLALAADLLLLWRRKGEGHSWLSLEMPRLVLGVR